MYFAIHFDNQPAFPTIEIHHIRTNRVLVAELDPGLAATKPLPEQDFRQTHFLAQLARENRFRAERARHAPSTALRAVPLPVPGRIFGQAHAAHPFFSIHAWQLPFARSRTRPI